MQHSLSSEEEESHYTSNYDLRQILQIALQDAQNIHHNQHLLANLIPYIPLPVQRQRTDLPIFLPAPVPVPLYDDLFQRTTSSTAENQQILQATPPPTSTESPWDRANLDWNPTLSAPHTPRAPIPPPQATHMFRPLCPRGTPMPPRHLANRDRFNSPPFVPLARPQLPPTRLPQGIRVSPTSPAEPNHVVPNGQPMQNLD